VRGDLAVPLIGVVDYTAMKLTIFGLLAAALTAVVFQTAQAQTPETVKVRGCLAGNGSDQNPWTLKGAVLPAPPIPAPAPGGGGGGGGRGGGAAGGGGRGGGAGQGGAPADGARGAGGAGRGGPPPAAAAAPAAPTQPPVDLRLMGIDMTPWRNMFVEIEGTLGPRPATGLRELKVSAARSAYGDCR